MKRLALMFSLLATTAAAQTFPPDSGGGGAAYDGGAVTNPFLAPVGCGATPGYAFVGRTAEGLCSPSAGKLSLVVPGGTEVFQISDTNLDVTTSAAASWFMEGANSTEFLRLGFHQGFGAGGNSEIRLENGTLDFVRIISFDGTNTSTTDFTPTNTTFSDPIEGASGSIDNTSFGFSVQPDAGMWITGAAGTVLIQNKDITPDTLGRARLSIGEEFWSLSATHDTVDTRMAFAQGSSEASAEMRLRQGATEDTANETELFMDPDQIAMRVEDTGVDEAQFLLDENSTAVFTLTDGANVSTTTFSDTETTFSDPIQLLDPGTKPTCTSTIRGQFWYEDGGALLDTVEVCLEDGVGIFSWRILQTQPGPGVVVLKDDFMSPNLDNSAVGELGWRFVSATPLEVAPQAGHPGIVQVVADGAATDEGALFLSRSTTIGLIFPTDIEHLTFYMQVDQLTDIEVRVGVFEDVDDPAASITDGVWFDFTPATSANWRTATEAAGTQTVNVTTTAVATGTWYRFDMIRLASGNWEFYLDGTLEFTHSTNLPGAVGVTPAFVVVKTTAADRSLLADYFSLRSKPLAR